MIAMTENLADIQDKDRFDVVLANPPFGGKERKEVQQNFPIRTGETAFLFLQHFIKMLKAGGRGGVVIKNTFLSNTDNASVSLRKLLLESCNLHTVLDCPGGTFQGAGTSCTPNDCPILPGACCQPDGACASAADAAACASTGGTFEGAGTDCSPNPCPVLPGACCQPDGACASAANASACASTGGTFEGAGTSCSPNPCTAEPGA